MRGVLRFLQLGSVAVLLSLMDGRSAQAPPESVTRFRAVEGYSLFITVKSDDDMKVEFQGELLQRKYKETFTARIDLTERHLDIDYVEWTGEGFAEQNLEQKRKEVHAAGHFVQEIEEIAQGRVKTKVKLNIDELQRTFQVWVDADYSPGTLSGFRKDDPKPTEQISGEASLSTTGLRWVPELHPLPASGLALKAEGPYPMEQCGTYCENFDWAHSHFDHAHKGRVKIELVPLGASEPKLILTPPDDYSTWRPKPPLTLVPQPPPPQPTGNVAMFHKGIHPLSFLLQLRYKDLLPTAFQSSEGEQLLVDPRLVRPNLWPFDVGWEIVPADTEVVKVTFQLTDVSRYPGECMNWPLTPEAEPQPDLEFVPHPSYGNHILEKPYQTLTILDISRPSASPHRQGPRGTVRLGSRDGAAVGVLIATAELEGRPPIHGIIRGHESSYRLLIPDHEEGKSDIAKGWRKEKRVTEIDYFKDEDDNEKDPMGDTQFGDGLTVWEEYRGFREGGQWRDDCNPRKKDLFIQNSVGADAQGGIDMFRTSTDLVIHERLHEFERKGNRVINFNRRDGHSHIDQHCLVLRASDDPEKGTAKGEWSTAFTRTLGPPKNTEWVNVIISRDPNRTYSGSYPGEVVTRNWQSKHIAHELSHAIGVKHHGDGDPLGGVRWTWTGPHRQLPYGINQVLEGATPITVVHERGLRPMTIQEIFGAATSRTVYVGYRSGQHSGDADCVMRYMLAEAYQNVSNLASGRIVHGQEEPPGFKLCDSPAGTRFNHLTNVPQSRYGPADTDKQRGDCIHRFVISDRWNGPLHK